MTKQADLISMDNIAFMPPGSELHLMDAVDNGPVLVSILLAVILDWG